MIRYITITGMILMGMISIACTNTDRSTQDQALKTLHHTMNSPGFWVQVHTVEYMIDLGLEEDATVYTDQYLQQYETIPQKRIGYWRCKYQLATSDSVKKNWLDKIIAAYTDKSGSDRIHAAETLAKLRYSLKALDQSLVLQDLESETDLAAYTAWGYDLPLDGDTTSYTNLVKLLESPNQNFRKIAGYAFSFLTELPKEAEQTLLQSALQEPLDSKAMPYLVASAYIHSSYRKISISDELMQRFARLATANDKESRMAYCRAVGLVQQKTERTTLEVLMNNSHPIQTNDPSVQESDVNIWNEDVSVTAAYTILKIFP